MRDPQDLYTVSENAFDAAPVPVLVHALRGSLDAGHAGSLVARHLLDSLPAERVATFDPDELVDYRSRRPAMVFEDWRYTEYDEPVIALDLLRDDEGTPLLLLHGPEPDLRWDAFTEAVVDLVEQLGVQRTIGVHGIPMAVPHTRPVTVTAHATRDGLVDRPRHIMGTVQVPGNIAGLLELRLGRAGHDAIGFSANVPHYLAQAEYPQAAAELVRQIAGNTGLALPVGELEAAAAETLQQIEAAGVHLPGGRRRGPRPRAAVRRVHGGRRQAQPDDADRRPRAAHGRPDRRRARGLPRRADRRGRPAGRRRRRRSRPTAAGRDRRRRGGRARPGGRPQA